MLQKVRHFVKKHEKSSIWGKTCNFSNKLPCFCVLRNFLSKSWKKCLISWEGIKNRRFGKKLSTFRTNYRVSAFWRTFEQNVARSASYREKAQKILDLAKNLQLFEQTTVLEVFGEFFSKNFQKVPHFVKKHEKSSIWPKTCNFSNKLPCFDELFGKKFEKVPDFVKKHQKSSIWPETCNFSKKTTVFEAFGELFSKQLQKVPHLVKKDEKSSICCTKSIKLHKVPHFVKKHENSSIWPKSCNFFQQTTTFRRFGQLFNKNLQKVPQKVPQFAKKVEKSSVWPKLATFSSKLPRLGVWVNFSTKSCKMCLISRKSTKNRRFGQNLQLFRANYLLLYVIINEIGV